VERVPLPHPYWWACASLVAALASVVIFDSDLDVAFWRSGEASQEAKTVRLIFAGVLVVVAILTGRRARFAWLAYRPGPVETAPFVDATGMSVGLDEVMWHFRRTLSEMRLSPPGSVPGSSAQLSWLDVMRATAGEPRSSVGMLAGFASAMIVDHAYRVSGVLRVRPERPMLGLTVQVSLLPGGGGVVETVWDDKWSGAAEQGATVVAAFVLPRTRLCRKPPWTAWRGLRIPHTLLDNHKAAKELMRQRRYEEALERYYAALGSDPLNPYLRIELLQLKEQLGLHLDAAAGYADLIAVEAWEDRRLWRRIVKLLEAERRESPPRRIGAPRHGRQALLLARYRLVCQLANGDRLARQWQPHIAVPSAAEVEVAIGTRRERERIILRRRLRRWLNAYYRRFVAEYGANPRLAATLDAGPEHSVLRLFFQYLAVEEARHLYRDYRWIALRRRRGMPVTQPSLRMMRVWAPLQLYAAERITEANGPPGTNQSLHATSNELPALRRDIEGAGGGWPPAVSVVHGRVARVLHSRWRRPDWQAEYNAACTLAVSLLPVGRPAQGSETRINQIAEDAIRHLERAVSSADSGYAALRSQWLAVGDQDLNQLRTTLPFTEFLARYFPTQRPSEYIPTDLLRLLLSSHVIAIAQRYAGLRARWWEAAVKRGPVVDEDRPEAVLEMNARRLMRDYAANVRHWQTRLQLIEETKRLANAHGLKVVPAAVPEYAQDPVSNSEKLHAVVLRDHSPHGSTGQRRPSEALRQEVQVEVDKLCDDARTVRDEVWPELVALLSRPAVLRVPEPPQDGRLRHRAERLSAIRSRELWQVIERVLTRAIQADETDVQRAMEQLRRLNAGWGTELIRSRFRRQG
jgi:hypothetical protein